MKKTLLLIAVTFTALISMVSCKNTPDASHNANLIGTWVGKYDDQTEAGALNGNICVEVKEGNELIVHDRTDKPNAAPANLGKGTWSVEGDIFKFEYKYPNNTEDTTTHHNEGKLINDSKKVDGTKRQAGDQHLGGFYLNKQ